MLGQLNTHQREVTVVGGGIAGLLAAYRLERLGYQVELVEASGRLGGLIRSEQTSHGLVERAAHSLLASHEVRVLCRDLGVDLLSVDPASRARYIYRDQKMRKMPIGLFAIAGAFLRAYFILADRRTDPRRVTVEQWGLRHLGRSVVDYLLNPFLRGVYAARPSELAIGAVFPKMVVNPGNSLISQLLRNWRLGPKNPRDREKKMVVPRLGMEALTQALGDYLRKSSRCRILLNQKVEALSAGKNWVISTDAISAAGILGAEFLELSQKLSAVRYAPLITATVFTRAAQPPRGIGVLVPEVSRRGCLGILFNSSAFSERICGEGLQSFSVMLGGTSGPELFRMDDHALEALIRDEMRVILGVTEVTAIEIKKWERAIPIYSPELMETWEIAAQYLKDRPGIVFFGNYTGQVSIRGMIESSSAHFLAPAD